MQRILIFLIDMKITNCKEDHVSLKAGLIFDGDDTLWETMHLYLRAKEKFFSQMAELGFNRRSVKKIFESIDVRNVQIYGFSKNRFPKSIEETYMYFCHLKSKSINENKKRCLAQIGKNVFKQKPKLIPYARKVLLTVKRMGYRVVLATKGDYDIQKKRIRSLNLARYFDHVYILHGKSKQELIQIINDSHLDIKRTWVVGNSIKSDINPALSVGLRALWIPYHTWDYEKQQIISRRNLRKIDSIKEVPKILERYGGVR